MPQFKVYQQLKPRNISPKGQEELYESVLKRVDKQSHRPNVQPGIVEATSAEALIKDAKSWPVFKYAGAVIGNCPIVEEVDVIHLQPVDPKMFH